MSVMYKAEAHEGSVSCLPLSELPSRRKNLQVFLTVAVQKRELQVSSDGD